MKTSEILQIYTASPLENYTYLLIDNKNVICIDPYSGEQIHQILKERNLELNYIINTHDHYDHTMGNLYLKEIYRPEILGYISSKNTIPGLTGTVSNSDCLEFQSISLKFIHTPGHTDSHVCIFTESKSDSKFSLFSGDTLFTAGVGRCTETGNIEDLYKSIYEIIYKLPDSTRIYPGHEYSRKNLKFTLKYNPENKLAAEILKNLIQLEKTELDPVELSLEKKINLFLQTNINNGFPSSGLKAELSIPDNISPKEKFKLLRKLRDVW
jgi:hydroxyacylglutathione hydrolase